MALTAPSWVIAIASTILLGACFLLIVYFIPRGVVGLIEDLVRHGPEALKTLFGRRKADHA